MKITLEMQTEEQGRITIRNCSCMPGGSYESKGQATLKRDGTGRVTCNCKKNYDCEWSITQIPRTGTSRINILPTNEEDLCTITFDNYLPQGGSR